MSLSDKANISARVGSPRTNDLVIYLAMSLLYKNISSGTYAFILKKYGKKLSSWKGQNLFMAAKALLIQTSLNLIVNYAMQTSKLLISLSSKLERISRSFLWGEFDNKSKMHIVSWEKI